MGVGVDEHQRLGGFAALGAQRVGVGHLALGAVVALGAVGHVVQAGEAVDVFAPLVGFRGLGFFAVHHLQPFGLGLDADDLDVRFFLAGVAGGVGAGVAGLGEVFEHVLVEAGALGAGAAGAGGGHQGGVFRVEHGVFQRGVEAVAQRGGHGAEGRGLGGAFAGGHGQRLDELDHLGLALGGVAGHQQAGAEHQVAFEHGFAALGREVQQLHAFAHVALAPAFAHAVGDLLHAVAQLVAQQGEAFGLLHGVEVFALDVLDQLDLQHLGVAQVVHEHGDGGQLGQLGRAPAALAGDDLVHRARAHVGGVGQQGAGQRPHGDGLHQAVGDQAVGQGAQAVHPQATAAARVGGAVDGQPGGDLHQVDLWPLVGLDGRREGLEGEGFGALGSGDQVEVAAVKGLLALLAVFGDLDQEAAERVGTHQVAVEPGPHVQVVAAHVGGLGLDADRVGVGDGLGRGLGGGVGGRCGGFGLLGHGGGGVVDGVVGQMRLLAETGNGLCGVGMPLGAGRLGALGLGSMKSLRSAPVALM